MGLAVVFVCPRMMFMYFFLPFILVEQSDN